MKVRSSVKTDLRKVQSNQEKGCYQSYLREPETQTETGLILVVPFRRHQYRSPGRCLEIIERKAIRGVRQRCSGCMISYMGLREITF